ncbi:MAG: cation-transporting P-type ATPase [Haliangiales bacterium]
MTLSHPDPPEHSKELSEVLSGLQSDVERGLSEDEAKRRLEHNGPNRMTARRGTPAWRKFLEQLIQPLVVVLILAAVVSALLGHTADALVIFAVVLVNSVIGFLQEYRAERAIAALDALVVTEASVVREGTPHRVPSDQLVVGDVVLIGSGDSVPADLRLLKTHDLQVEEAALTGESVPVFKEVGTFPEDTVLGDRANMAYAGTVVTFGRGRGLVVATGDDTETGRIAGLLASTQEFATPLTRRIAAFSKLLVWVVLVVAAALLAIEALRGSSLMATFNAAVALAVGAIPEGLPAAVTVLLAVGVQSLARRRALVRKLPAVETLGSTTVICSDKTGTLTENEMTVTRFWTAGLDYEVTGVGYDPNGDFRRSDQPVDPEREPPLFACLRVGALCNDTTLVRTGDTANVEGDPTEAALRVTAEKACLVATFDVWQRLAEIPFESQHMYMATLHQHHDERLLLVKGSSDVLIDRCTSALDSTGALTAFEPGAAHRKVEELAASGLRVLCLAHRPMHATDSQLEHEDVNELTFVGLVGMIDPPRESARTSVAACHRAGIRVKMITGDHAVTASAVAEQLGLEGARDDSGRLRAMTGRELEQIAPEQLPGVAEEVAVFARVAPEQKLLLVGALQSRGHVVAMTGDGVNDAPALKKADLGIAMGKGGTDVARGASAMILTDDNFETITAAVEEGRGVYDNLVKFITWTLPTNGGEALVLLAALVVGAALPVLPVQILWVNMATALLLGVALVFEPKEPGLMDRPPRTVDAKLLDWRLGVRILMVSAMIAGAAFGLFRWSFEVLGASIEEARTIAVNTIVVVESAYLFACRSLRAPLWRIGFFSNKWVWLGAGVMLLAQLFFTYTPAMNTLFYTSPIDWIWWLYFSVAGFIVLAAVETYKVIALQLQRVGRRQRALNGG